MKVKVTYATEISSVGNHVVNLIEEAITPLEKMTSLLSSSSVILEQDPESAFYVFNLIDKLRKELTQIDESLVEAYSILGGYVKLLHANNENAIQAPQPESPQPEQRSPAPEEVE